jgi:RNA polymerase sigma-70 factor (ECF subfamily)
MRTPSGDPGKARIVVSDDVDWSDPRRFERLVDLHGRRVHAYLARRAPAYADDLLAEVWLAAYAARHRYDAGRGDIAGWLFGIARNVLLTHFRREKRVVDIGAPPIVDDWALVDARLDASAATQQLRSVLAAMPAEEREVLLLVAWEDLTPSEAAGVLGIPAGTARSRLHRARTRLISHATEREAIS